MEYKYVEVFAVFFFYKIFVSWVCLMESVFVCLCVWGWIGTHLFSNVLNENELAM